jgi:hypothetical protein
MILDFQFGKDTAEEIEGQLADCRQLGNYPVAQLGCKDRFCIARDTFLTPAGPGCTRLHG